MLDALCVISFGTHCRIAANKKPSNVGKDSKKLQQQHQQQPNVISSKIPTWKQRKQESIRENTNNLVTTATKESNMAAAQQILIDQVFNSFSFTITPPKIS